MKDVKIVAIIIGLAIDIGGSTLFGLAVGIAIGVYYSAQGVPPQQLVAHFAKLKDAIPFLLFSAGTGSFFTLLGAFVTAWWAKVAPVKNATIMGACSALLALFFLLDHPIWYIALGTTMTLGAAVGAGFLAEAVLSRRRPPGN